MNVPAEVEAIAVARKAAREAKDFQEADRLRDQALALGYEILDVAGGFEYRKKAPFISVKRIGDLRSITDRQFTATVTMIIDGFTEDAATCIKAVQANTPKDVALFALVSGEPDTAPLGSLLNDRTFIYQVSDGFGWGEGANTLLKLSPSPIVILIDPSTIFTGDAASPVIEKLASGEYSAVGWRGGLVNIEDEWRSVDDKGPGEVDVLFSYFIAMQKEHGLEAGGFNVRATFYRNADIEFSLRLRQAHAKLWQMDLPLEQARHHGYYDSDPAMRDEQSKKTYDRILDRFRGKNEILTPRR